MQKKPQKAIHLNFAFKSIFTARTETECLFEDKLISSSYYLSIKVIKVSDPYIKLAMMVYVCNPSYSGG